jgi:hypothetical protein
MKTIILAAALFILSCYPQRERTTYYIFTFENQAGYIHKATVTKHLFDTKVLDSLKPVGYEWTGLKVIDRGDTVYEY